MDVGKEGKIEMEGVFAWGGVCTMQCADDILLSCTLKTGMFL